MNTDADVTPSTYDTVSSSIVYLFLKEINEQDINGLLYIQNSLLEQLDKTNAKLDGINKLSAERYSGVFMATGSNLDDILQCPICLEILHDPKVLDCQHTFCSNCLKVYHASSSRRSESSNSVTCPTCRSKSNLINNSIDSLPGNYIVRDIIERQYGTATPNRPPGYAQQIQDRIQKMKKEDDESDLGQYIKPAVAGLLGVLGGLLLAKGIKTMSNKDKK